MKVPQPEKQHKANNSPLVSVVIPSFNSSRYIRDCLQSLRGQVTLLPFEVVLVDSSNDGTDRVVQEQFSEVRLFHFSERCSAGKARNFGVGVARADVILFLDTDCVAPSTWIDQMYDAMQDETVDAVCGSLENGTPWSITGSVAYYLEFFRFLPHHGERHQSLFLVSANAGFRKKVFRRNRYQDASIAEDFTFGMQLTQEGRGLVFLPSVSVRHTNKRGWKRVFEYQYLLGLGTSRYRRHLSPNLIRLLQRLPILVFLMPNVVMVWISAVLFRKGGFLEFLKFVVLLPVAYAGNVAWAVGFYRGLGQTESQEDLACQSKTNGAHGPIQSDEGESPPFRNE